MTHALTLTTRLDRTHIPPSGAELHLLIQISGQAPAAEERLPLNLAAVVDRSGSMEGPKLTYTRQALRFLVDQVALQDRLALITYDDQVETLLPSQPVVQKDLLKARIAAIESGGTTNLSGGLATGMQQITPHAGPDRVNRVLLMTDGLANVGVTDPETLIGWARTWRKRGLTLTALGVGADFNEDLLVSLAEAGGGFFHYIENPDRIPAIFAAELQGLLRVAGQGLHLAVSAEPGVAITGVIGYPPFGTPNEVQIPLPDLYGGEVKSLVLTLSVAAPPPAGTPLARVRLDYLPAAAGAQPVALEAEVEAEVTADPTLLTRSPDPQVLREVNLARAAEAREQAVRLADQGDLIAGAEALASASARLEALAAQGDAEAQEQLSSMAEQSAALREHHYSPDLRKQMRYQSHQARSGRRGPGTA